MGAEGWSYDEVLPYFKRLEDNKDFDYIRNGEINNFISLTYCGQK